MKVAFEHREDNVCSGLQAIRGATAHEKANTKLWMLQKKSTTNTEPRQPLV